ncbi:MAG: ABC transporter substrate-binding protein [Lachnospiraceae bacterium]|nr:ABC transporter substrate-binding protein [Lachnospiraceae bacterium]
MNSKKLMALGLAAVTALAPVSAVCAEEATEAVTEATTEAVTEAAEGESEGAAEVTEVKGETANKSSEAAPDWQAYNDMIAQIKVTTDTAEREALMHQAEDMLMETGAIVPLYYYNDIYLQKEAVTGIYSNNYGFKYFMFAENGDSTTLRLNLASEPDKLDPALNTTVDGACLVINSFEGLCAYNEAGEVVMALADNYEVSEDGLTYTFTLKPDLKWSDGAELNANDFVYSWNRAADPNTGADYAYMFDAIAKKDDGTLDIAASEDGQSLTINLAAPCVYFLDLCAFPAYYPVPQAYVEAVEGWEENPGAWAQEAGFVSNGAYTLTEWKHNESMVYTKNPNYYRADEVKLETLEFMLSAEDTAIFAAYNAGDIDFADTVPNDEIQNLLDNPEFHIVDNLGTYYVCFNVNSPLFEGKTPEQASAMRRGLTLLIDRDYIVENIGQTGQQPANTFIPAGMADGNGGEFRVNDDAYTYPNADAVGYYDPSYDAYEANLEEARALLEEAGFVFTEDGMLSDETPLSITYITNDGSGHVAIAEALQQDFAAIGAEVSIETNEWNVFLNERKAGNFDMCRNGWLADFNDPINMLEMWTSNSGNNDVQFGK